MNLSERMEQTIMSPPIEEVRELQEKIESLERQRDALLGAGKYLIDTMNAGDGLGEAIDIIEAAIKSVEESHE